MFEFIGHVHSCFKEKFSTPRQSGLVPSSNATIIINKGYSNFDAFKDLEQFEYIWVIFYFHLNESQKKWHPTVRPPRLGGNKRMSVFATRSPFRPNPIGLSLVKLERVFQDKGIVKLDVSGHDLVHQTPVIDIKPYHPQADSVNCITNGWINKEINSLEVDFDIEVDEKLKQKVLEVLSLDPRPRFHRDESRIYGSYIDEYNVEWIVKDNVVIVKNIIKRD